MPAAPHGQRARTASFGVAAILVLAALAIATDADAGKRRKRRKRAHTSPVPAHIASAPSYKYAQLSATACISELRRRKIVFKRLSHARGVLAPVRIPKGLSGIKFHTELPRAKRSTSVWEVFDCRLILALHDFTAILQAHHIDDVVIFSGWRPPSKKWKKGKLAKRHPGGLAIDIKRLRQRTPKSAASNKAASNKAAGQSGASPKGKASAASGKNNATAVKTTWLDVQRDYNGKIGSKTCGPDARPPTPATAKALSLRAIVCEAAKARIFTSMLTPNFNKPHFNHFHFDLAYKSRWRSVR